MNYFPTVTDEELQYELNETMKYCLWVYEIFERKENSDLELSLKKDLCIHFGAIVEWILLFIISELDKNNKIQLIETEHREEKRLYELGNNTGERFIAIFYQKEKQVKPKHLDMRAMIDMLYDQKKISKEIYNILHRIREERNGVHISKKSLQNDYFVQMDFKNDFIPRIDLVFKELKKLL